MDKILFCQFSTNLINKDFSKKEISNIYYSSIWKNRKKDGYFKGKHFWEIPLWIAEISGLLKKENFKKDLFIIQDLKKAINYLNKSKADFILFSCLEVNKAFIMEIIKAYKGKGKIILGGYTDLTPFKKFNNVFTFESLKDFATFLNIPYAYDLDFSLFKNYKIIPRLNLSSGCLNHCKFCSIEKNIKEKSKREIIKQVRAFKDLKFKLIYLNDKTFFQAKNHYLLKSIYRKIKKYNPDFKGFIIQTTATAILKHSDKLKDLKIYACEIGIESFNNEILKDLNKPINEKIVITAIEKLKALEVKIIPNFIIGFIQENKKTYLKTLSFIKTYLKDFFILNIYNLAIYQNTDLSKEIKIDNENDLNELIQDKTFYNAIQKKNNSFFYNQIFKLGLKVLNNHE